jgi:FSR family fosmidomycin resistance protein-like MFS transporter
MAGRAATGASLFFLFGQGGLSLGPALAGVILQYVGQPGLLLVTGLVLPIGLYAAWQLRPATVRAGDAPAPASAPVAAPHLGVFILILVVSGLRTWAQMATTTFAPKFFQDAGVAPAVYGVIVALFMAGSAIGGVAGGLAGDRWGAGRAVALSLAASAAPFFFLPLAQGPWIFAASALAGFLNGGPHSVLVTTAQRVLPGRAGLASGLILGLTFGAGALGAWLTGLLADQVGLGLSLQANALISLAAAALSLALGLGRRAAQPAAAAYGD